MKLPFNYSQEEISLSGKILREVFRQNEKYVGSGAILIVFLV